jgi:hypothetical protein
MTKDVEVFQQALSTTQIQALPEPITTSSISRSAPPLIGADRLAHQVPGTLVAVGVTARGLIQPRLDKAGTDGALLQQTSPSLNKGHRRSTCSRTPQRPLPYCRIQRFLVSAALPILLCG